MTHFPIPQWKTLLPFTIIFAISVLFRTFFFQFYPAPVATEFDSVTYGMHAKDAIVGKGLSAIFNPFRPPTYVSFVTIGFLLTGKQDLTDIYAFITHTGGWSIIFLQSVLGLIGVLVFYDLFRRITRPSIAFIGTILFAINPLILTWERIILSESVGFFLVIVLFYQAVLLLKKPTLLRFLLLSCCVVLTYYLRTTFILFFPLIILILLLKKFTPKLFVYSLLSMVIVFSGVFFHYQMNNQFHNVSTVQIMGSVNVFGRILKHDYMNPPLQDNIVAQYADVFRDFDPKVATKDPWSYLPIIDPVFYYNRKVMNDLQIYNRRTIETNLPLYIKDVLADIPKVFETYPLLIPSRRPPITLLFFQLFHVITVFCAVLSLSVLYFLLLFFRKRGDKYTISVLFGVSALLFIVVSIAFSYQEYSRIISGSLPLLYGFAMIVIQYFTEKRA